MNKNKRPLFYKKRVRPSFLQRMMMWSDLQQMKQNEEHHHYNLMNKNSSSI